MDRVDEIVGGYGGVGCCRGPCKGDVGPAGCARRGYGGGCLGEAFVHGRQAVRDVDDASIFSMVHCGCDSDVGCVGEDHE